MPVFRYVNGMICGSCLGEQAVGLSRGPSTVVSHVVEPSTCSWTSAAVIFQQFRFCL